MASKKRKVKKAAKRAEFGLFPDETLPDIDGVHAPVSFGEVRQQRAAIKPTADQRADGRFHFP